MIEGINHITLAVSDLSRSVAFYADGLGCRLVSRFDNGAYFDINGTWFCLSLDPDAATQDRGDYTHIAFSIAADAFDAFERRLSEIGAPIWKENRSEGASIYFLDPDGHKLEAHVGTLASRLAAMGQRTVETAAGEGCH